MLAVAALCGARAWAGPVLPGVATVESLDGDVQARAAGQEEWAAVTAGAALSPGQSVKTGPASILRLRLNQDTVLAVMPESAVRLEKMEKHPADKREAYEIRVDSGAVYCRAALMGDSSLLVFNTPHAAVRVTGTTLSVAVAATGTTAQALNGTVALTSSTGTAATLINQTQATALADGTLTATTALTANQTAAFSVVAAQAAAANQKDQGTGLTVTAPVDGFMTSAGTVTVVGSAQPNTMVNVNGTIIETTGINKAFSIPVSLIEGQNTITVTATRKDKTDTMVLTVIRDSTPPILILTQPAGGSFGAPADGCAFTGNSVQCTIIGLTEPGALLTIDNVAYPVQADGSFSAVITVPITQESIVAASSDALGNRTSLVLIRAINPNAVTYLTVTVSPSTLTANGQNTAMITIQAQNFFMDPVDATATLTATAGGTLSSSSVILPGGTGAAIFAAGVGNTVNPVTITATSGGVTGSAILTLTPDAPPTHD
jgi:hypothetical protein